MINAILKAIFSLVISLVNILLTPIDLLITSTMPDISNALDMVGNLFNYIASIMPWATSWFGFNSTVMGLFVAYMTFELTTPLIVSTIKLALKWYNKIKP